MKNVELNFPTLGFVIATRAMIGVGLGLLLSDRFSRSRRQTIAKALLGIGAASTVPALIAIFRGRKTLSGAVV
jgi:hypothetical protein